MLAIAIVNKSAKHSSESLHLQRVTAALQKQLVDHLQPLWRVIPPALELSAGSPMPDASPLVLFDNADQAGALGYHTEGPDGVVYGRVFLDPIFDAGGTESTGALAVSAVISHEILEMVGDSAVNAWADGPEGTSYAWELCDPVENDSYDIDSVAVSNFVLPAWFDPQASVFMRFDYLAKLSKPFTMTPGGYMITRDGFGNVKEVYGREYPEWRLASKVHPAARTAKRR